MRRDLRVVVILTGVTLALACSSGGKSGGAGGSATGTAGAAAGTAGAAAGQSGAAGAAGATGAAGNAGAAGAAGHAGAGGAAGNPSVAALTAAVMDTSGNAIAGVTVTAAGISGVTGADGSVTLSLASGGTVIAVFTKAGYVDGCQAAAATLGQTSYVQVAMMPQAAAQTLDATNGGTVSGPGGSSLTVPAGALVDATGKAVTGTVTVTLTPLDPTNPAQLAAYPGDLMAKRLDASIVALHSYGVLDIDVRQNGGKLQVATGKTLTASIPAASKTTLPASSTLWSFDETTGLWKEESATTLQSGTNLYTATLPHLSIWNIDDAILGGYAGCISGTVVNKNGTPVAGANVEAVDSAQGVLDSAGSTDFLGHFCLITFPGSQTEISASKFRVGAGIVEAVSGGAEVNGGPLCSPDACGKAPNIVIGQSADAGVDGGPDGGSGPSCVSLATASSADGGAAADPFPGCAAPLGEFFNCFQPSSSCTSVTDTTTLVQTMTYSNGSKEVVTITGGTEEDIVFYGPTGTNCGSEQLLSSRNDAKFILTKGIFITSQTTITCPDNEMVPITGAGSGVFAACGGFGPGGGGGGSCPEFGAPGSPCKSDSDCGGDMMTTCCLANAGNVCEVASACSVYQQLGCNEPAGMPCPGGICCPETGLGVNFCFQSTPALTSCP
jgi:hypothetical protein